ncbi:MAG TPA: nuclease-related domain-containing protein [Anaerolineae bacterium]|nr:nuclease-related domain-containing protein [Anaerolineae bacterium]
MRTTTDEEMVLRGGRLGQLASFFAMVMVFAGLIVSFTEYRVMTFVLIAFGVAMYTVGARGQEQARREPQFVRKLTETLSEFDDRYHIYHHVLPADHVLLTPHGVFVMVVRGLDGSIRCFKDKWVRDLTLRRALRFFTEESLGNPTKEMLQEVESVRKYVEKHAPHVTADIEGCVVFINPEARLELTTASVPALPLRRLRSHIRKASARSELPSETLSALVELFEEAPRS